MIKRTKFGKDEKTEDKTLDEILEHAKQIKILDQNQKKRFLVDMIDSIYLKEISKGQQNIKKIKKLTLEWARGKEMPPNIQSSIMRIEKESQELKKKKRIIQIEDEIIEEQSQAQKIAEKYKIKIDLQSAENQSIQQQISSFCVNDQAFIQFKKNQSIDKLLENYNQATKDSQQNYERLQKIKIKILKKQKQKQSSNQIKVENLDDNQSSQLSLNHPNTSLKSLYNSKQLYSKSLNSELSTRKNEMEIIDMQENNNFKISNDSYKQQNQTQINFIRNQSREVIDKSNTKNQNSTIKNTITSQNFFTERNQNYEKVLSPEQITRQNKFKKAQDENIYIFQNQNTNFDKKSYIQRKLISIQQPYADIISNNHKHRQNLRFKVKGLKTNRFEISNDKDFQKNVYFQDKRYQNQSIEILPRQTNIYFNKNDQSYSPSINSQTELPRIVQTQLRTINRHKMTVNSKFQNFTKSQSQLKQFMQNTLKFIQDESSNQDIDQLNQKVVEEEVKYKNFINVSNQLGKLRDQKPEFLRQFYDQAVVIQQALSEEEIDSRNDYEKSRLDHKLHALLEGERKKKLQLLLQSKKKLYKL